LALGLGSGSGLGLGFEFSFFRQYYSRLLPTHNITVMCKQSGIPKLPCVPPAFVCLLSYAFIFVLCV